MAALAAALRDEAGHLALVRVLVAVGAAGGREVQRDRRPARAGGDRLVALVAGHREVRAGQGVGGLRVVLGAEAGGAEAVDVVAGLAAPPVGAFGQLAGVGVAVTVGAAVVLHPHRTAGDVALLAAHPRVLPGQRVGRLRVVEAGGDDRALPARRRVTARAVRAEAALVGVLVAARAVLPGHRPEDAVADRGVGGVGLARRVALLARDRGVAPRERPGGLGVVEAGRRLPRLLRVARGARARRELPTVLVLVARGAVGDVSEVRAGLVALLAGQCLVLARQRVARLRVVEGFLPGLAPPDELVLDALVLDVAGLAVPIVGAGVQALAGGDALLQRLVAPEALARGHALLGVVAIEAARAALELRVGAAQGAGRDLGHGGGRHEGQCQARGERPVAPSFAHDRPTHP